LYKMASLSERRGTNCTDAEWDEILEMGIVSSNETPTEWMNRIWPHLQYFRENNLIP
ncbi:11623_t:CDS:1, partial [Entrophospora sp. SA101]